MRFTEDLRRTAAELEDRAAPRIMRQRHQYLKKCADELSVAACSPDPAREVEKLGIKYTTEFEKRTKHAADAGMLSEACRALTNGEDPARLPPSKGER